MLDQDNNPGRNIMNKYIAVLIIILCTSILAVSSVYADEFLPNPSLFSGGSIAVQMEKYWLANYLEITEYMKQYLDFKCEHYSNPMDGEKFDQIVCESVNNPRARDVIINFFFTGDHEGMTGLQEVVFNIGTPETGDIQEVLEYYWLPEAFPWHFDTDYFYDGITSLVFHTGVSVQRFDLPDYDGEGEDYITVDMWDIAASRMGVG